MLVLKHSSLQTFSNICICVTGQEGVSLSVVSQAVKRGKSLMARAVMDFNRLLNPNCLVNLVSSRGK